MLRINVKSVVKELLPWFMILYLISFILTTFILLFIGYVINESYGYHPLPPFYLIFLISFIISIFLFIPWTDTARNKIKRSILSKHLSSSVQLSDTDNRPEIISTLETFILDLINLLRNHGLKDDIYSRIILHLCAAGACEELALFFSLSDNEHKRILHFSSRTISQHIPLTGYEHSQEFYSALNNDSLDMVHRSLIDFGSAAMAKLLTGRRNGLFSGFSDIVSEWRQQIIPELSHFDKVPLDSRPAVLLFTDLISSPHLGVSEHNLSRHNLIVREVLAEFGGQEVSSLPTGIFAYFSDEAKAILAAIKIQQKIYGFNLENPTGFFSVRIGVHSGEVIFDGKDLFGDTVKYASFLCSIAGASGIFTSEVVRDKLQSESLFTFKEEVLPGINRGNNFGKIYSVYYDKWGNSRRL